MNSLLHEIRYATRKLLRAPGFTTVALLTLTLAVGATTAIFSVVNGVLLQPLPFAEPDRLVRVGSVRAKVDGTPTLSALSPLDFQDMRAQSRSFTHFAAINTGTHNLTAQGVEPMRLRSARVSANWFEMLGVRPIVGRGFLPEEEKTGAAGVAVLSQKLWALRFRSDPRVIGQTIALSGQPYTIVGVAPKTITYPASVDVWLAFAPEAWELNPGNRGAHYLAAVARLAPGATAESATKDLEAITRRLAEQYPQSNTNFSAATRPLHEYLVANVEQTLWVMLGAVGFVLLIACANVANLQLVRAAGRETEIAVRTALGAGRGRIVRQLVVESVLLSLAGAVGGIALAAWIVDAVVAYGPKGLPRLDEVSIDLRVLGFTAGVALLTGVVFGLVPALHAMRPQLAQMLRDGMRGSSGKRATQRTRSALVVTEMALAVVLLVGAGLLIRSFVRLVNVDPGFRADNLVTFDLSLPGQKYPYDREARDFQARVLEQFRALPGVEHVAITSGRPLLDDNFRTAFDEVGKPPSRPEDRRIIEVRSASQEYFAALGIPLVSGRAFTMEDRAGRPPAVVVNHEFVRRYFPSESPIGKRIYIGWGRDSAAQRFERDTAMQVIAGGEIVGVVGDVKQFGLATEAYPTTYFVYEQHPQTDVSVMIRTTGDPRPIMSQVRTRLRQVDPDLPVVNLQTMSDAVSASVAQPRFYMVLLAGFAGVALALAAIGIYGVISYSVSQRTRELGIRIALGATQQGVLRLVLGHGLALSLGGVVVGLGATYYLARFVKSLLFGVPALDPLTYAAVPLVLTAVAAIASLVPARRAARVDPVVAMRNE